MFQHAGEQIDSFCADGGCSGDHAGLSRVRIWVDSALDVVTRPDLLFCSKLCKEQFNQDHEGA